MKLISLLAAAFAWSGCQTMERPGNESLLSADPPLAAAQVASDQLEQGFEDTTAPTSHAAEAGGAERANSGANKSSQTGNRPAATARSTAASETDPSLAKSSNQAADPASVRQAVSALVKAGAIDRAAEQQLADDLNNTEPQLRGQLLDLLQTSIAAHETDRDDAKGATDGAKDPPNTSDRAKPRVAARDSSDAGPSAEETDDWITPPKSRPHAPRVQQAVHREPVTKQPASEGPDGLPATAKPTSVTAADTQPMPLGGSDTVQVSELPTTAGAATSSNTAPPDAVPSNPSANSTAKVEALPAPTGSAKDASTAAPLTAGKSANTWQGDLDAAIDKLSGELETTSQSSEDVGRQAMLRLLCLVDGKRDLALRPIAGAPPAQQDFWSKQLFGLANYLDAERNPHAGRRAAESAVHLRDAAGKLGELATLSVRNPAFCTEVKSFGIYKKFETYEFTAGQELLVYAEVENFKSKHTETGYHTALKSSYEILDQHGARVAEHEFSMTEEVCQNARRDFFVRYFVTLPPQIYGGKYTLHLYIVDEHSQKMDHGTLEFTIKSKSP